MNNDNMKQLEDDFTMKAEYDFSKGIKGRFYSPHKRSTTIRLDYDIILYFKKMAGEQKIGYQSLMNSALREYIHNHTE